MRTLIRNAAMIITVLLFTSWAKANIISVSVMSYSFTPSSFSAHVGDTVKWTWVNGGHTTTSTSVPSGAASWSHPMNNTSTTFEYVITTPGTYNYWCAIHTTMMEASFTVTTTGIATASNTSKMGAMIFPNPSMGQLTISLPNKNNTYLAKVYTTTGEEIYQTILSNLQNTIDLSAQPDGIYFIYLKSNEASDIEKVLIIK